MVTTRRMKKVPLNYYCHAIFTYLYWSCISIVALLVWSIFIFFAYNENTFDHAFPLRRQLSGILTVFNLIVIMTIQKNINTKGNNIAEDDDLGRKMYLVLCLQRGHLEEALEAAKKLLAKRPKDSVLKDLIR